MVDLNPLFTSEDVKQKVNLLIAIIKFNQDELIKIENNDLLLQIDDIFDYINSLAYFHRIITGKNLVHWEIESYNELKKIAHEQIVRIQPVVAELIDKIIESPKLVKPTEEYELHPNDNCYLTRWLIFRHNLSEPGKIKNGQKLLTIKEIRELISMSARVSPAVSLPFSPTSSPSPTNVRAPVRSFAAVVAHLEEQQQRQSQASGRPPMAIKSSSSC